MHDTEGPNPPRPSDGPAWAETSRAEEVQARQAQGADTLWQLRTLVEGMPQLVWRSCDLGRWTWASPQWLSFTGQTQEQSHGLGWMEAVHPEDRATVSRAWDEARPHGRLDVEFRLRRASNGCFVWHRSRSVPVRDTDGRIVEWLGTTTDIQDLKTLQERQAALLREVRRHADELQTEVQVRKEAENRLLYTAFHDDLTKLHNRAFFMGQLRRLLTMRAGGTGRRTAVLILDLDRFKQVNDNAGHGVGDMLLAVLGRRLQGCVDENGTAARLGGDEFGLIVEGLDAAALAALVARVQAMVRRPARFGRREIVSSCSLGATWITEAHTAPEQVLQEADIAMYEVKRSVRGGFRIFTEAMRVSALRVVDLRTDLREAVARGELDLHYQPICCPQSRAVTGFEALLRWRHPQLGMVPPDEFIPLAQECGVLRSFGRWVLQTGCAQLKLWQTQFPARALTLNVNVCGDGLVDPAFVGELRAMLDATGIEPGALELEITEGVLLDGSEAVRHALSALRGSGVRIAIDDFGTGYSSLSYLDRYEVDTVKIDGSFIRRMLTQARTRAIVEAVIRLGQALSVRIVAEEVEEPEELALLNAMGCAGVQGFLLGRPCPAEEITRLLEAEPGQPVAGVPTPG